MKRVRDFLVPQRPLRHSLSISPDASPEEALERMRTANVARLMVAENGACIGVVQRSDLVDWALVPLEERMTEWERSRYRWQLGPLSWEALTWNQEHTGDAFVHAVERYADFGSSKRILEVGPGYGRLLKACLDRGVPFAHYCGLDVSKKTCTYLRQRFSHKLVSFMHGDVESVSFDPAGFDIVISSATFKHLFPSIEPALENLSAGANPGCMFCIDFIEGTEAPDFERDKVTFIRMYSKPELLEILERVGLEHVAFDEVEHAPGFTRLLTVARKPS